MSSVLSNLEHQEIWKNFEAINAVPRASKKEERIIAFMVDFGKRLGLETIQDATGNVIIRKPATPGRESAPVVVLQSHLDMVHQKNNDTVFDFDTQGIRMYIDGDWVRAEGTTLGADNGLGVAAIMGILESTDIPHPALEALFTIDEETGMTGAKGLESGLLKGTVLLNLDTEDDHHLDIGCAGGIDVTAELTYTPEDTIYGTYYTITVKGLKGGHSGMEIHKGLGNANKLMNRILYTLGERYHIAVAGIDGGGLRNAIPRESTAVIATDASIREVFEQVVKDIRAEFRTTEPDLVIEMVQVASAGKVLPRQVQERLLRVLYAAHNGVYKMSSDFDDLVETSNNVARVQVGDGLIKVLCLTRSSVESSKQDLARQLKATFELMDATVTLSGDYPGWSPNAGSPVLKTMVSGYETLFGDKPDVVACHAGLECGILAASYPGLDMISFGPTILGAHSPDERVSISSVNKFWKLLLHTLATI